MASSSSSSSAPSSSLSRRTSIPAMNLELKHSQAHASNSDSLPLAAPVERKPRMIELRTNAFGKVVLACVGAWVLYFGYHVVVAPAFGLSSSAPPAAINAVAVLVGPGSNTTGTIYFAQSSTIAPVRITGLLKGLDEDSDRGFHIHELGDATNGCLSSGSHYNPYGQQHGGPNDARRHVGDLGNVRSDSKGVASLDFTDNVISLGGPFSIIGRTVVVHLGTDDLGLGGTPDSLTTGNAGGRAACGVIGIAKNA